MIQFDPANPLSDFRNFLIIVWGHLRLPRPTKRQLSIAHYLQFGPNRKVVEAFRGVGKSWITAAFVVWLLFLRPELNVVVVSASKTRADNFTTFCLRLINEMPLLSDMIPREDKGQRCSKVGFDVGLAPASQTPSMVSLGITGSMTGNRADIIVADDVEVPNNSATQLMREKLGESIKEFDAILKPGGSVVYLGTPQCEDSIYRQLPARGYEVKVWPILYPTEAERDFYAHTLASDIVADLANHPDWVGQTTEPSRFDMADVEKRKLSYGLSGFGLQFMLNTRLSDADRYPLKLRDICFTALNSEHGPEKVIWACENEYLINDLPNVGIGGDRLYRPVNLRDITYLPYTGCVMAIDPAGRGRDETGYSIVAYLHGNLFLLDSGGFSDGYSPATLQKLAELAKRFGVKKIIAEANFGDGMFTQLLKPVLANLYPVSIEEVKHSIQKEKRIIDTLEPVIAGHRLVVDRELLKRDFESTKSRPLEEERFYQLFYQLTRITRERGSLSHDDRLDSLSIAVAYWTESMARDQDKAARTSRAKLLDKELKKFTAGVFGRKPKEKVWGYRR